MFNAMLGVFLVIGLVLNATILEIGSADSSLEEVRRIEQLSWSYAAIGFFLVMMHLLDLQKKFSSKIKSTIGIVSVFLLSVFIFSNAPGVTIENIEKQYNESDVEVLNWVLAFKKAYNGTRYHGEILDPYENKGPVYTKMLLVNLGITPEIAFIQFFFEPDLDVFELAAEVDSPEEAAKIFGAHKALPKKRQQMYGKYISAVNSVDTDMYLVEKQAKRDYAEFTSEKAQRYLYHKYYNIRFPVINGRKIAESVMAKELVGIARDVGSCRNRDCLEYRLDNFIKHQRERIEVRNSIAAYANSWPVFRFDELCEFRGSPTRRAKRPGGSFFVTIRDGRKYSDEYWNNLHKFNYKNPDLHCFINMDKISAIYSRYFESSVVSKLPVKNFNIESRYEFVHSAEYGSTLGYIAKKEQGKEISLPRDWRYDDEAGFVRSVIAQARRKLKDGYRSAIKEEFGFYLPLNMSRNEFMSHDGVSRSLEKGFIEQFGMAVKEDDFTSFYRANRDEIVDVVEEKLRDFGFDSEGSEIIRLAISPTISMTLYFLFFFSIFCILIRNTIFKKLSGVKSFFANGGLFLYLFVLPFVLLIAEGHYNFPLEPNGQSSVFRLVYDWALGWQLILHPLGDNLKSLLDGIIQRG